MANVFIEEQYMEDIGNAIRNKTGKTDLIYPANMASEILGIQAGSSMNVSLLTATESDLADGMVAYGQNGTLITGTVYKVRSGYGMNVLNLTPVTHTDGSICFKETVNANGYSGRMYQNGAVNRLGGSPSSFGDAAVTDVSLGKTFTSAAGLKSTGIGSHGQYVWERFVVDYIWEYTKGTSTTTRPSDFVSSGILSGSTYFARTIDGQFILSRKDQVYGYFPSSTDTKSIYSHSISYNSSTMQPEDSYVKYTITGSTYSGTQKGFSLGYVTSETENAYPDDGIQGDYWYVKVAVGDDSSSNSGSDITGTVITSGTFTDVSEIDTGLSDIEILAIDCTATSGAGLVGLFYMKHTGYARMTGRSSYMSDQVRTEVNDTSSHLKINGGIVSHVSTSASMAIRSGVTYTWVAAGTR